MPTTSEIIVRILLKRLREEPLTAEEAATLAAWENESPEHKAFVERMLDEELVAEKIKELLGQDDQAAWSRIEQAIGGEPAPVRKIRWYRGAAAAAIIITISGISYYFFSRQTLTSISPGATSQQVVTDIAPGRDRAILTLSDGSSLNLTDAANGTLAQEQGVEVVKLTDGQLEYRGERGGDKGVQYNTLSTPRGGYYQLRLPDNTQVWLNAASSLKYPTSFANSAERRVEITGEAYFEVAKDEKTFRVVIMSGAASGKPSAPKGEALVLGTHFNIKAYDEDGTGTSTSTLTLLEGKVQVAAYTAGTTTTSETTDTKILSPGQQARMGSNSELTVIKNADLDHVIAWKDGFLSYREANLTTIMREISRWYNVEVVYNTPVNATATYTGLIPRNITLSKLIKAMNESGVEYTMTIAEGNKLIVTR